MSEKKKYLFAGIPFAISDPNSYIIQCCKGFETNEEPELIIDITQSMHDAEGVIAQGMKLGKKQLDFLAFHRAVANYAALKDIIVFHSSSLMINGKAYLFAAPSGTGKSTHSALWRDLLGDQVTMINDDKPFIRLINGRFIVYGSPWQGIYNLGNNISAPLAGICFLNQAKDNIIQPLSEHERLPLLLRQTYHPESEEGSLNMLRLLAEMSEQIPMWHLDCNVSREAAELSYNTMRSASL